MRLGTVEHVARAERHRPSASLTRVGALAVAVLFAGCTQSSVSPQRNTTVASPTTTLVTRLDDKHPADGGKVLFEPPPADAMPAHDDVSARAVLRRHGYESDGSIGEPGPYFALATHPGKGRSLVWVGFDDRPHTTDETQIVRWTFAMDDATEAVEVFKDARKAVRVPL